MKKTLTDDVLSVGHKQICTMLSGLNNTLEFIPHPFERVQLFILGLYLKGKTSSINNWWLMFFCFLFD